MHRNLSNWLGRRYDVLVIGGGINGAAIAREATQRGLCTALVERGDFGWATSSNSAKIAHCGMRYLQHADFKRMRESIRERNSLVANAPHLVGSQPFLLPIYGHGIKGRETIAVYLKTFDLLSRDKQQFDDPARRVPYSRVISPNAVAQLMPGVSPSGLTGGGVWEEGMMHNTERLLLSYVRAGIDQGLDAANYAEVVSILQDGTRVTGATIVDRLSGDEHDIRADVVINATGPWALKTLLNSPLAGNDYGIHASKAFTLLTRSFTDSTAFTFPIKPMYVDKKAIVDKGSSLQFAIPWRDSTMVASLHLACEDDLDTVTISENEIETYIELINEGYPAAKLSRSDVHNVLWGIIPAEEKGSAAPLKHFKIIDHSRQDDLPGLITVVGVKYTTARDIAERTIDLAKTLGCKNAKPSNTKRSPLWGGNIDRIDEFADEQVSRLSGRFEETTIRRLVRAYGKGLADVIKVADGTPHLAEPITGTSILKAEVVYAVREEMALSLSDVVLRRTDMGSQQEPPLESLEATADLMALELGWSTDTRDRMIREVVAFFRGRPTYLGLAGI